MAVQAGSPSIEKGCMHGMLRMHLRASRSCKELGSPLLALLASVACCDTHILWCPWLPRSPEVQAEAIGVKLCQTCAGL